MKPAWRAGLLAITAVLAGCALGGCGDSNVSKSSSTPTDARNPEQRYTVSTTVLENASHGPQLCLGGVNESLPPQCGGPDVKGLDWGTVADKRSVIGTTWADLTLVGTFDGTTFTVTESPRPVGTRPAPELPDFSPACAEPEGDASADTNTFREPQHPDLVAVWVSNDQRTFNVLVRPGAADAVRQEIRSQYKGLLCIAERDLPTQAFLRELQDRVVGEAKDSPFGGVFGVGSEPRRGVVLVHCAIADAVSKAWAAEHWGEQVELLGLLTPVD